MSPLTMLQVLVPLFSFALFTNAQMYGYPYPYMPQYQGGDVNSFGMQGYPQVYPQSVYPYPSMYPGVPMYAPVPQYATYPSYPVGYPGSVPGSLPVGSLPVGSIPTGSLPVGSIPTGSIPVGSVPSGSLPTGTLPPDSVSGLTIQPQYPTQYPSGTSVYPSNFPIPFPQTVQTPYGNIPVEIIDVDDEIGRINATEVLNEDLKTVVTDSKSSFDVVGTPGQNTKYVKTDPSQTKIVRTLDPKGGEIHVEVQTNSPTPTREQSTEDNQDNEDNETATKWRLFG